MVWALRVKVDYFRFARHSPVSVGHRGLPTYLSSNRYRSGVFKPFQAVFVVEKKPEPKGPGFSSHTAEAAGAKHCTGYGMVRVTVVVCFTPPPEPVTAIV